MNKLMMMAMVAAMGVAGPTLAETTIGYSGQLRDANGAKLPEAQQNPTITFTFYDQPTGGTELGTDVKKVLLNEEGNFSVELTFPALAESTLAKGNAVYIGLTPGKNDGEISPRQQILPTPRAIVADKATKGAAGFTVEGGAFVDELVVTKTVCAGSVQQKTRSLKGGETKYADLLPAGVIVMWSGSQIPDGWALCDGKNGTPDLRGKFIVGAGEKYNVTEQGGSETLKITSDVLPQHTHYYWSSIDPYAFSEQTLYWVGRQTALVKGAANDCERIRNTHVDTSVGFLLGGEFNAESGQYLARAHSQGVAFKQGDSGSGIPYRTHAAHQYQTTSGGGSGTSVTFDKRPPYFALCYIMKL